MRGTNEVSSTVRQVKRSPGLRVRLANELQHYFDLPAALASAALVLFSLVQLIGHLDVQRAHLVGQVITGLWVFLALEFFAQLLLAADRLRLIRQHWLRAVMVVLPFFSMLRVFSLFRFATWVPQTRLALFGSQHASRTITILRRRHLGQLLVVSLFVVLISSTLV